MRKDIHFLSNFAEILTIMGSSVDRNIQVMGIVNLTDDSFSRAAATSVQTGLSMRKASAEGL